MRKSVRWKVLTPVFLLAFIAFATLVLNMVNVNSLYHSSESITDGYMGSMEQLDKISSDFSHLEVLAYSMCVTKSTNDRADMLEESASLLEDVKKQIEDYETTLTRQEEIDTMSSLKSSYESYMDIYAEITAYVNDGNKTAAQEVCSLDLVKASSGMEDLLDQLDSYMQENVDEAVKGQTGIYNSAISITLVFLAIIIALVVTAIVLSLKGVVTPLKKMTKQLDGIIGEIQNGNGDLTKRISIKSKDEIGRLSAGMNVFLETLQNIMEQIVTNSRQMGEIVSRVAGSIGTANTSACDISALMEELAATMEEVSSTTAAVNGATANAETEVADIASSVTEINEYSFAMQERAEKLKRTAVQNKEETSRMMTEIIESLQEAIEESKSVRKIDELTEEILSVSGQTNLLALNASIEAARAGEAGKGFAVVADEIRQLADSTRETANNIQHINVLVIKAVERLAGNANQIVEYIDRTVMPDYEEFVETGLQYSQDAGYVNKTMEEFRNKAVRLKNIMGEITHSIEDIATIIQESASGVGNAANSTTTLVENIDAVNVEMDMNQKISNQLKEEAEKFKQ